MPNIGPMELIIVLAIALIVVGPKQLPKLARSVGSSIREFRQGVSQAQKELEMKVDPGEQGPEAEDQQSPSA